VSPSSLSTVASAAMSSRRILAILRESADRGLDAR